MTPAPDDDDLDDTRISRRRGVAPGGSRLPDAVPEDDDLDDTRISRRRGVAPGGSQLADAAPEDDDLDDTAVSAGRARSVDAAGAVLADDPDDHTMRVHRAADAPAQAEPDDDTDDTARVPRRRAATPVDDRTVPVRRRATAAVPDVADDPLDDTLVSARAAEAASRSIPHAVIPPRERAAADGAPTRAIYRPRADAPVRVERATPAPQAPQEYVDTAAQQHAARSSRTRGALLVTAAVGLVAALGVVLLVVLLTLP